MWALYPFGQPSLSLSSNVQPHQHIDPVDFFVVPAVAHCPEHMEHLSEPVGRVTFGQLFQRIHNHFVFGLPLETVIIDRQTKAHRPTGRLILNPTSLARYPTASRFSAGLAFFDKVLQGVVLKGKIGLHALELGKFRLHLLHLLELVYSHAPLILPSSCKRSVG